MRWLIKGLHCHSISGLLSYRTFNHVYSYLQEVGDKGEKITQLEKEKASLIRELFEARTKHKSGYDDTTFM